jgi:hypothetical protein
MRHQFFDITHGEERYGELQVLYSHAGDRILDWQNVPHALEPDPWRL